MDENLMNQVSEYWYIGSTDVTPGLGAEEQNKL
jgi:hypothetical protein